MCILCLETDQVKRYVDAPIGTGIMVPFTGLFSGWIGHGRIVRTVSFRRLDDKGENTRHAVGRCRNGDRKMGSGSVSAASRVGQNIFLPGKLPPFQATCDKVQWLRFPQPTVLTLHERVKRAVNDECEL